MYGLAKSFVWVFQWDLGELNELFTQSNTYAKLNLIFFLLLKGESFLDYWSAVNKKL